MKEAETNKLKIQEVKYITDNYGVVPLVKFDKLNIFKEEYYPTAEYAIISADAEYNDQGYSSGCDFEFFDKNGGKLSTPDFGKDYKKENEYFDKFYNLFISQETGSEFSAPRVKYFFEEEVVSI